MLAQPAPGRLRARLPAAAPRHYVAIEEKLAAAMPDYQLAYRVRYGVGDVDLHLPFRHGLRGRVLLFRGARWRAPITTSSGHAVECLRGPICRASGAHPNG